MKKNQEIIKEFIKKIKNDVISVVLFGSYAKNEHDENSDIDFIVIIKNDETRKKIEQIQLSFLLKYGVIISPIILTKRELKKNFKMEMPLFYGMLTGYVILFDKENFFKNNLMVFREQLKSSEMKFYYRDKEWLVSDLTRI